MNNFPLPQPQIGRTAGSKAPRMPQNRALGLALGQAPRWVAMTLLLLGNNAASADTTAEAAATRTELAQRLPKELGVELAAPCFRSGQQAAACSLAGDFDGDDKPDLAVLVRDRHCASRGADACQRVGIAFLLGNGRHEVLGSGRGRWRHVDETTGRPGPARPLAAGDFAVTTADAWSWRVWRLTKEGPRPLTGNAPHPLGNPPGMRRDALELSGGDAAILVYRSTQGWIQYDLGY